MKAARVIFVTGKGGTGKSTVSAAAALARSRRGPALVADLDGRRSAARLLGIGSNSNGVVGAKANLEVVSLTARAELEEFITRIVPLRAITRRMLKSRTFQYVTAALPGLEGFLMLERLRLIADEADEDGRVAFIDAPATGGAIELLRVARGVEELARRGTLNRLAGRIIDFLHDRERFEVVITMRPERLALSETLEAASILRTEVETHVRVVLNGVADALFSEGDLSAMNGIMAHAKLAERRRAASEFAASARLQLATVDLEVIETPALFTSAMTGAALEKLSRALSALA